MIFKRKLNGTVDLSLPDQESHKSTRLYITCEKSKGLHLAQLGLTAGRIASSKAIRKTGLGEV